MKNVVGISADTDSNEQLREQVQQLAARVSDLCKLVACLAETSESGQLTKKAEVILTGTIIIESGESLNKEDLRVLQLVSRGLADKEIAETLCLSPHTIEKRVGQMRSKLGLRNRTQLAVWAAVNGVCQPEIFQFNPVPQLYRPTVVAS